MNHHSTSQSVEAGSCVPQDEASLPLSDGEMIHRILAGEINSFAVLITRHQIRISSIVRRHVKREADADDMIQQVFIKAYQKLNTWKMKAPFEHWLSRIALTTCYDYLRQQRRNTEVSFSQLSEQELQGLKNILVTTDTNTNQPDAETAREWVELAMGMLTPVNRMSVDLFEIQGKSCKEIAELMGWSLPATKIRVFRARHELKKILKEILRKVTF